jgi:hypothetical protein
MSPLARIRAHLREAARAGSSGLAVLGRSLARHGLPVVAVAAAVVALAPVGWGDADAGRARLSVDILRPADNARVTGSGVTARVRAFGPHFHATLNGRDVTRRFGEPVHGVRTARFRRGRDFGRGVERLTVRVGKPFGRDPQVTGVNFRVLRRNDRRLRLSRTRGDRRAPLSLRVRSTRRIVAERVWVNGRRHRDELPRHSRGRGLQVRVSPHHGLRYGRNRVTVEVEHADGTLARRTRIARIRRTRPLADAGPDRVTALRRSLTLDASMSRPSRRGAGLARGWRVVARPTGSSARVERVAGRMRFRPDRAGHYRLRLTASMRGARAAGVAAGAQAAAVGTDDANVTVGPTTDPMGVPIQTINRDGGITVGGKSYPKSGSWVHLLVLDSETLLPRKDVGDKTYNVADTAQFTSDVNTVANDVEHNGDDDVVILSGQGNTVQPLPDANRDALEKAFDTLGVTTDKRGATYAGSSSFNHGHWSVIAEPGTPVGGAWQNYNVRQAGIPGFPAAPRARQGDPGQGGSLNGYLQKYIGTAYQFISPEFVSIDTRAPGSGANNNIIRVGDKYYGSAHTSGGKAMGVQVLVLDTSTLQPVGQQQYDYPSIRNPDGTLNATQLNGLKGLLDGLTEDPPGYPSARFNPPLVILQTFGNTSNHGLQPLNNHQDWVWDTLPDWGRSGWYDEGGENPGWFKWCGGSDHTKTMHGTKCAEFPNSTSGLSKLGDHASITSTIGRMAGMPARTAVANIGGTPHQGAPEAMSLVGSPHPYYDDDVTVRVGDRGQRLVGTLRRTQQSQWRVAGASPTDAFDTSGFWETALGPETPWPVAPGSEPGAAEAHEDIVAYLWPSDAHHVKDVREQYLTYLGDKDWDSYYDTLRGMDESDLRRDAGDDEKRAFAKLKALMLGNGAPGGQGPGEFGMISQIKASVDAFEGIFTEAKVDNAFNVENIGDTVKNQALQDADAYQDELEKEIAQLDAEAPIGDALYFGADLVDLFPGGEALGGVLGLFASSWDLFSDVAGSNTSATKGVPRPPDYPRRIQTTVDQLGTELDKQYDKLNSVFDQLERLYVGDPRKMLQAWQYFNDQDKWNLDIGDEKKNLQRSIAMSAQAALFNAVMPVAYDQWFMAPVYTSTGNRGPKNMSLAGPRDYHCDDGANPFQEYPDKKKPSDDSYKVPDSSLHYVRFEPSWTSSTGRQNVTKRNHLLGRGLKSKSYPMRLTVNDEARATNWLYPDTVGNSDDGPNDGRSPPASLTDKLFAKPRASGDPQDPSGLLIEKDEFFGLENWTTPRLMCGLPLDGKS